MSVSGLSSTNRIRARDMACQAAALMLHKRGQNLHYTEGDQRWEGIEQGLKAWRGEYPHYSDCSSSVTWWLWNALDHFHVGDVVNGARWQSGYTGTLLEHGHSVKGGPYQRGDAVIYGTSWPGFHTAMYVGGGMVVSHGCENGPNFLRYDQMGQPILDVRRFI